MTNGDALEPVLALEPEDDAPAVQAVQVLPVAVVDPPLANVLGRGFPLARLLSFVPDPKLKEALARDVSALTEAAKDLSTPEKLATADRWLATVKGGIDGVVERFREPCGWAFDLHRRLTGLRSLFVSDAEEAVRKASRAILDAQAELDRKAEAERQERQRQADAEARARVQEMADKAVAAGAPAQIVERLQSQVETAKAPPVPVLGAARTSANRRAQNWKARLKGWTGVDPNPGLEMLDEKQLEQVRRLMLACTRGEVPLMAFEINWSYLNRRASSDKTTFDVPELEAYDAGKLQRKA